MYLALMGGSCSFPIREGRRCIFGGFAQAVVVAVVFIAALWAESPFVHLAAEGTHVGCVNHVVFKHQHTHDACPLVLLFYNKVSVLVFHLQEFT